MTYDHLEIDARWQPGCRWPCTDPGRLYILEMKL